MKYTYLLFAPLMFVLTGCPDSDNICIKKVGFTPALTLKNGTGGNQPQSGGAGTTASSDNGGANPEPTFTASISLEFGDCISDPVAFALQQLIKQQNYIVDQYRQKRLAPAQYNDLILGNRAEIDKIIEQLGTPKTKAEVAGIDSGKPTAILGSPGTTPKATNNLNVTTPGTIALAPRIAGLTPLSHTLALNSELTSAYAKVTRPSIVAADPVQTDLAAKAQAGIGAINARMVAYGIKPYAR